MPNQEKYENKEKDEFFEQLKKVEITPLPYFSSELLALPEDVLTLVKENEVTPIGLEDVIIEIKKIQTLAKSKKLSYNT